jgi:hypothetical protein
VPLPVLDADAHAVGGAAAAVSPGGGGRRVAPAGEIRS